jgi:hypothetical protein
MVPCHRFVHIFANEAPDDLSDNQGRANYYFFGAAKEILNTALSPPAALPALTAHFLRFAAVVPHLPLPIVPVATLNFVFGKTPAAVIFTGVARKMSQPASPLAFAWHSVMYTSSFGLNPVPDTVTTLWFVSPVDGVTTNFGFAAAFALVTLTRPLVNTPVLNNAATATTRIVRIDITLSPNLSVNRPFIARQHQEVAPIMDINPLVHAWYQANAELMTQG